LQTPTIRSTSLQLTSTASSLFLRTLPPPTAISPLSLHDALPISNSAGAGGTRPTQPDGSAGDRVPAPDPTPAAHTVAGRAVWLGDRKSTRLNSSHVATSYAVFCLKKKKRRKRRMSTRGSDDGIRR